MRIQAEIIEICSSSEDEAPNHATEESKPKETEPKLIDEEPKHIDEDVRNKKINELLDHCVLAHNRCRALESLMNVIQLQRWHDHIENVRSANYTSRPYLNHYNSYGHSRNYQGNPNNIPPPASRPSPPPPPVRRPPPQRRTVKKPKKKAKKRVTAPTSGSYISPRARPPARSPARPPTSSRPKAPTSTEQMAKCKAAAKKIAQTRSTKPAQTNTDPKRYPPTQRLLPHVKPAPRTSPVKVKKDPGARVKKEPGAMVKIEH